MPALLAFIPAGAWRWIAIFAVGFTLFGTGFVYGKIGEKDKWDRANQDQLLQSQVVVIKQQGALTTIDAHLQENLDANRASKPVIRVVERVRNVPGVCPAAEDSREPVAPSGAPTDAELGEALAHDANAYVDCVATLDQTQAALKVLAGQ